jgi:predicted RNA methylase
LGGGTGRTALPVARNGQTIHVLEPSPEMSAAFLQALGQETPEVQSRVHLHPCDMRSFELGQRFDLVVAPFRAFLHCLDRTAQLACLTCCWEHLRPGGTIAFNVFHPSLRYMSESHGAFAGVWRWIDRRLTADGGSILLSVANHFMPAEQKLLSLHRFERFDANGELAGVTLQELEMAYLYPGDLRDLLKHAGFYDIDVQGGFGGEDVNVDGCELVVRALRR